MIGLEVLAWQGHEREHMFFPLEEDEPVARNKVKEPKSHERPDDYHVEEYLSQEMHQKVLWLETWRVILPPFYP